MGITDRLNNIRQRLSGAAPPPEDERLLQLYWNRAELKKELSRLQDERYKLLEAAKKQDAVGARMREHLEQLENYLGDPDIAPHALIYFQLRGLWRACAGKLGQFVSRLREQQEARERRQQLSSFDKNRRQRVASYDTQIAEARSNTEMLEAQLKVLEARLNSLRGFWNYFRRRTLAEEIDIERARWDIAMTQVTDLSDEQAASETAEPPTFPGLSVDGRRAVNIAAIAYAQQLVASLAHGGLAMLAKETTARRAFDVRYGGRDDCARLMALLHEAVSVITEADGMQGDLKARIETLRVAAKYRNDMDCVPAAESIGTLPVPASSASGVETVNRSGINVLTDDYWNIGRVLLP